MCMCLWERCRYSLCIPVSLFSGTLVNQQVWSYQGHLSLAVASLQHLQPHKQLQRQIMFLLKQLMLPSSPSQLWSSKAKANIAIPPIHCKWKKLFPFDFHFSTACSIPSHSLMPGRHHTSIISPSLITIQCILIIFKQVFKTPVINWELLWTAAGPQKHRGVTSGSQKAILGR